MVTWCQRSRDGFLWDDVYLPLTKVDIMRSLKASMKIKRKTLNEYVLPVMTYGNQVTRCTRWHQGAYNNIVVGSLVASMVASMLKCDTLVVRTPVKSGVWTFPYTLKPDSFMTTIITWKNDSWSDCVLEIKARHSTLNGPLYVTTTGCGFMFWHNTADVTYE